MKIALDQKVMHHYIPGSVFQQGVFSAIFRDLPNCSSEVQRDLVNGILPGRQYIACVGDTFSDAKHGRYFAAWLALRINARSRSATPLYVHCDDAVPDEFTGVVSAPERNRQDSPCVSIISFGTSMTDVQVERARDVIAKFDAPVILQCANTSPLEIARRLQKPCHYPFYLTGARTHEV